MRAMSLIDSVRVLGAMARITAPTLVELARGSVSRSAIDERTRWFGRRVVEVLDVKLEVSGAENVPPRAVVYMSNHQSHLDIPMLYATLPSPTIRMLGKTELFRIPLWGRGLRAAEFVEVDRSNHGSAVKSIEQAARLLRDGVSIYLAPEGTRWVPCRRGFFLPGAPDRGADRPGRHSRDDRHPAEGGSRHAVRPAGPGPDRTSHRGRGA